MLVRHFDRLDPLRVDQPPKLRRFAVHELRAKLDCDGDSGSCTVKIRPPTRSRASRGDNLQARRAQFSGRGQTSHSGPHDHYFRIRLLAIWMLL